MKNLKGFLGICIAIYAPLSQVLNWRYWQNHFRENWNNPDFYPPAVNCRCISEPELIIHDEISLISNEDLKKLLAHVEKEIKKNGGQIVIVSSPKIEPDPFGALGSIF